MTQPTDDLIIRVADDGDFDAVRALYRDLVPSDLPAPEALQRQTYKTMLEHPGLTILLAVIDRQAVASCTLVVTPNLTRGCASYALIENVVTQSNWRGRGIGHQLMQAAIDRAFGDGCFKVMLLSGSGNARAHRFYKTLGFSTTKTGFELRAPGYAPRRLI
ncbi:GNAT family N-acetyltransferase [Roseibium sediminicola]|uniref:GNAT family N-acetyltransferase n=1 Tax=Roseibium sediminicola TaxID=2933272 RepID=A0ABT0GQ14_9HYPH|nr:GNAT family N-acetyltransferase [Roseibium sp. CAU 1639]MCK7611536.1 GNAT family N-acetyltransferase [Roseibium sp. CAU 1639]